MKLSFEHEMQAIDDDVVVVPAQVQR